jgi:ABC-type branched-subunit amino acid transport system permease subunit
MSEIYAVLALSLSLLVALRTVSLGHAAFYGMGAYFGVLMPVLVFLLGDFWMGGLFRPGCLLHRLLCFA